MNTIKLWTSAALAACMTLGGCRLNDNCRGTAVERRVAFLGGSITEMHGYRPRVMAMLQKKYPDVKFVEIAAGQLRQRARGAQAYFLFFSRRHIL